MAPSRASAAFAIPSLDPLPNALRLPSEHPHVFKLLSGISRPALLRLASDWCSPGHIKACGPYVNEDFAAEDPECPWTAATSIDELVELYENELLARKGSKREVLDRVLEGDWRHGISLQQLAMAESAALLETNGAGKKWSALLMAKRSPTSKSKGAAADKAMTTTIPNFHAPSFILSLHKQISALAKAHYHISRSTTHPMTLIRIALFDTPYATLPAHLGSPKVLFLAFPDGAPFIYVTLPSAGGAAKAKGASASSTDDSEEGRTLHAFVLRAIPLAISKPHARYELRTTALTARSLEALLNLRGASQGNAANGGWSIYSDDKTVSDTLALIESKAAKKSVIKSSEAAAQNPDSTANSDDKENAPPRNELSSSTGGSKKRAFQLTTTDKPAHQRRQKRNKILAAARFGVSGHERDGKPLARLDVLVRDGFSASDTAPSPLDGAPAMAVTLSFEGTHVFAGVRALVEAGVVDGKRVPGWMTGEEGTSFGVVRGGRLKAGWDGI